MSSVCPALCVLRHALHMACAGAHAFCYCMHHAKPAIHRWPLHTCAHAHTHAQMTTHQCCAKKPVCALASVHRSTRPSIPSGVRYGTRPDPLPRRYRNSTVGNVGNSAVGKGGNSAVGNVRDSTVGGEGCVPCRSPCTACALRNLGRPLKGTVQGPQHMAVCTVAAGRQPVSVRPAFPAAQPVCAGASAGVLLLCRERAVLQACARPVAGQGPWATPGSVPAPRLGLGLGQSAPNMRLMASLRDRKKHAAGVTGHRHA